METEEQKRAMARLTGVGPHEMTFEDGMRICEYLTSCKVMFRQAEAGRATPEPEKLAQLDAALEAFLNERAGLAALWRRLVGEHQPMLREYIALISAVESKAQ